MRLIAFILCAFLAGRAVQRHADYRAVVRRRLREIGRFRIIDGGRAA